MATLTKQQRDKLPTADFGDPTHRLFPVVDQSDLDGYAKILFSATDDPAAVLANLKTIAGRKGLSAAALLAAFGDEDEGEGDDEEEGDEEEEEEEGTAADAQAAKSPAAGGDEDDEEEEGEDDDEEEDDEDDEDDEEEADEEEDEDGDEKAEMSRRSKAKFDDDEDDEEEDDEDDEEEDDDEDDDEDDTDYEGDAEMSVGFSLGQGGTAAGPDGYVLRKAPIIFRAGDYPDKNFSMSPEELRAAAREFKPVDIDLEHKPSVLDRKLGRIVRVGMSDDGFTMSGEALIPAWLDSVLGKDDRKLSAAFDRSTKRMIGCSLVRNPRVSDATLMAAFAAYETGLPLDGSVVAVSPAAAAPGSEADPDGAVAGDRGQVPAGSMGEWRKAMPKTAYEAVPPAQQTDDGMKALKAAHDAAADAGACGADDGAKFRRDPDLSKAANARRKAAFSARRTARQRFLAATFNHDPEAERLRVVHDLAANGGCFCRTSYETGKATKESGPTYPQQRDDAGINDGQRLNQRTQPTAPPVPLTQYQTNAADTGTTPDTSGIVQGKESRGRSPYEGFSADPQVAQLQDQVRRLQTEKVAAEAVNFADTEVAAKRSLPADRDSLIASYTLAAQDDLRTQQSVVFDNQTMTRVEFLKRNHLKRLPHSLTAELVPTGPANQVVFGATAPPPAAGPQMSDDRRKELLGQTALGRSLIQPKK